MFERLRRFFLGPAPQEAYGRGRAYVDFERPTSKDKADRLFALASGGFNVSEAERAFDRGVQDRLGELGFHSPY